jgi:hypothetical protein
MANIQIDDILAGTPAVQCKTKVSAALDADERGRSGAGDRAEIAFFAICFSLASPTAAL